MIKEILQGDFFCESLWGNTKDCLKSSILQVHIFQPVYISQVIKSQPGGPVIIGMEHSWVSIIRRPWAGKCMQVQLG